jgi:hypothetical protein
MRQHHVGPQLAIEVDQLLIERSRFDQRIVSSVEESHFGAECGGRILCLGLTDRLDLVDVLACSPEAGRLASLTEAEAGNDRAPACGSRQGKRSACPPDEISWMGGYRQYGRRLSHIWASLIQTGERVTVFSTLRT